MHNIRFPKPMMYNDHDQKWLMPGASRLFNNRNTYYKCKPFINGLKGEITLISVSAERAIGKVLPLILKAFN